KNSTTSMNNSCFGNLCFSSVVDGNNNTGVGSNVLSSLVKGSNNVALGYFAGGNKSDGNYNLFLGYEARSDLNVSKAVAIGYGAVVNKSNALVLGGVDSNAVSVGINTSVPANRLNVVGDFNVVSSLGSVPSLFVSGSGNVGVNVVSPSQRLDVNGVALFRSDLNVSSGSNKGVSFSADSNRICFPSNSCEMLVDWNGSAMFFGSKKDNVRWNTACICPFFPTQDWIINDGQTCMLTSTCSLSANVHIKRGGMIISNTGSLVLSSGKKLIIEKSPDANFTIMKGGKLILNK
ncbi:MAG: hypothetical protein QXU92_03400, partial [Candidatus Diapherotrites archaeon]